MPGTGPSRDVPDDCRPDRPSGRATGYHARSKRIRTNVRRAPQRIQRLLRPYEHTPDCGLAVYAGVVDGDLVSAVFDDPPEPVTGGVYRCDDRFDLDPVRAAVASGDTFGVGALLRFR